MQLRRYGDGKLLTLDTAAPLGKGGEAGVYAIQGEPTLAAKVYSPGKDPARRIVKLLVMLENPPDIPHSSSVQAPVAWPLDLLAHPDTAQIVGFVMPRVHAASQVIDYYNPQTRLIRSPLFDYRYLMRASRNLAATVRALHARGYVIGDLKHSNVLVAETALVTLVDTDSFQVRAPRNGQLFPCPVHTPDFTPPELQYGWEEGRPLTPEQDNFGLGVMLFQLLMEGTHPFAGVYAGEGDPPPFEERIAAGHFPYGTKEVPCRPGSRHAPPFSLLAPPLRELFVRCFEEGHSDPAKRPEAQEWQAALQEATRALCQCEVNARHFYGSHLSECPWCERKRTQWRGVDPFPSDQEVAQRKKAPEPTPVRQTPVVNAPVLHAPMPITPPPAPANPSLARFVMGFLAFAAAGLFGLYIFVGAFFGGWTHENEDYSSYAASENRKVRAVAWSPDGKTFYGGNRSLYAWDAASGSIMQTFQNNEDVVAGLALSHDGKLLASYSGSTVKIWDTATTQCLFHKSFPMTINVMTLSPDGKTLAVGTNDEQLTLWDVQTEKQKDHLNCATYTLTGLCYSPNGASLAACGNTINSEGMVKVWNLKDDSTRFLQKNPTAIFAVAFSPNNKTLAWGGETVSIADMQSNLIIPLSFDDSSLHALAFSPDGAHLALSGSHLEVIDIKTHTKDPAFPTSGPMNYRAVAFSPDGKILLVGSDERGLDCYDTVTGHIGVSPSLP